MSLLEEVQQAKTAHKSTLFTRPNVVGLGVGYKVSSGRATDELSLVVLVRHKLPPAGLTEEALIPQDLSGIRTDVVEAGDIRPLSARTRRWRPAPGGVSLGHYKITAGTLGCALYDRKTGARLILSNNHVLANGNDASPGDPILQPGPADGGQPGADTIARLLRFHPIRFNTEPAACSLALGYARVGNAVARLLGSCHQLQVIQAMPTATNRVDAAVACPLEETAILDEALEIGQVTGAIEAELGMAVRKSGRTTALTTGKITILDATVSVNYGPLRAATFEGQVITSPMSQGGDSGSLLVASEAPKAVGLLFAGSEQITIHNPIHFVLDELDIGFIAPPSRAKTYRQASVEKAQAVREAYQDTLMSKANVVGVGVGLRHSAGQRTDEVGLVVTVRRKVPLAWLAPDDVIPSEIEGVPVDVREAGQLEAY